MRVMLVNSPWIHNKDRYGVKAGARWAHVRPRRKTIPYYPYPFAMAYATANLNKHNIESVLLDAVALGITEQETLSRIKAFSPDLTILETSTPSINSDMAFGKVLSEQISTHIAFSGPHATALPHDILGEGTGLAVLRGEYDETLVDLAHNLDQNKGIPGEYLENIEGISWILDGKIFNNQNRPLIRDLDQLPYPQRMGLPMDRYTDPSCKKFPNVSILSSRGCPHQCIFCLESTVFFHSPSFRARDPDKIVEEMKYTVDQFGAKEVYFDDSSFTASLKHAQDVSEAIIESGLKISWSCMADARVDSKTLALMKKSGCIGLKFGVETADPELMVKINKKLDLNQVRNFAENCKKLGLHTHGTFMFGLPGETRDSIANTLEFAFSLDCTSSQFSVATPFPGTPFYDLAKQNGWLITDDWSMFDGGESPVLSYPECSRQDIIDGLERAKRRKIMRLITHPAVLTQYLWKLYKIKGFWGLMGEITGKAGYLLESRKKDAVR